MASKSIVWLVENTIGRVYNLLCRFILAPQLIYEWRKSQRREPNERPLEYGFAMKWLSKIYPHDVLDVGSGISAWPHILANCWFRVTAIDKMTGYWKGGYFNRHYRVVNDDITNPKTEKKFDVVTCLSVLEHIPDHNAAIKGMFEMLKPGGYLILSFPYNERQYIDDVYRKPGAGYGKDRPYVCQIYSRKEIDGWLVDNSGKIVDQECYEVFDGELWTFGQRIYPPHKVDCNERCHLTCLAIQKT